MFKQQQLVNLQGKWVPPAEVEIQGEYPFCLNFYTTPPTGEITLSEFETFALDRLQVLRALEAAALRNKSESETVRHLDEICKTYLPLASNSLAGVIGRKVLNQQRRKDHISHFLLRLAYCRTEDLRQWFLRHEVNLFKLRFKNEPLEDKRKFLSSLQLDIIEVSANEKALLAREFAALSHQMKLTEEEARAEIYYRSI